MSGSARVSDPEKPREKHGDVSDADSESSHIGDFEKQVDADPETNSSENVHVRDAVPMGDGQTAKAVEEVEEEDHVALPPKHQSHEEHETPQDVERAASTPDTQPPIHSVFSHRYKIFIVTLGARLSILDIGYLVLTLVNAAGVGSFFSPFTANIYFPALNALGQDLHVSSGLINLSLTTYMIFQGLAPTFM